MCITTQVSKHVASVTGASVLTKIQAITMSLETDDLWGQLNGQRTTILKDPTDEDDDPCVADEGTFARTGLIDECVLQSDVRSLAEVF